MGAAAWFRLDLRRRWRSLLVLTLLVAVAVGTVMTATAGARRGDSAVDRLLARTLPADVAIPLNRPGFDWSAVRELPEVSALSTFGGGAYVVDGVPEVSLAGVVGDDEAMRTVERPVVLTGRLADPERADEVTVTPRFVDTYGLDVGDAVTIRLFQPATADAFFFDPTLPPDGPVVRARIVGVVRSVWHGDTVDGRGMLMFSPGLFAEYPENLGARSQVAYFNAIARLHDGEADIPALQAELDRLTGGTQTDVWNLAEMFHRHAREFTAFEANALLLFALAAGVAAVFLVGQPVARYTAAAAIDLGVLRAAGMTPGQVRLAAALGPVAAALAGGLAGAAGAVVASRWFPIGTAALAEPDPGIDVDPLVLVTGVVAVVVLVAGIAAVSVELAARADRVAPLRRRSAIARAAAGAGLPVPVVVGTRFALEPGRGRQAVAVRPALLGAVTGVLGVLAAFTVYAGVDDASGNLARFGQTYQLTSFLGLNDEDFVPAEEVLSAIAADPDVVAVNDAHSAVAQIEGAPAAVYAYAPVGGALDVVTLEGRLPEAAGEIVLGPTTAAAVGAGPGDRVEVVGSAGPSTLVVTGIAFVPDGSHNDYASGAWVTQDGYASLYAAGGEVGFKFHEAHVALRPGADPQAVAARLAETAGAELAAPEPPTTVAELRQIRQLPVVLAAFLVVLALGAVGHALATAVRRRRHELAVLRALGLTRRQCRGVVVTQATVLALVGLAVGIPLGVALGRTVWRYVAETTPVFYVAPAAATLVLVLVPAALAAANLLAAWPSHRVASMRVGHVLRAE
ncbi:ABC transporter permease [Jiangella asiatica]|uniref:FtsX-like permease family protein n=1 Tax=Jiangella asiatica TaxID=2530372 RepID=A0A4R5CEF3_9ACTN|nr:FtsX-like permease family protein [Jiangella asiatica]TDD96643.1 FtsX-like permease family protein [Jiangella asiatica]